MSGIAGAMIVVVTTCFGVGVLAGAAIAYPVGRRHGIKAMAEEWRKSNTLFKRPVPGDIESAARSLGGDGA